MKILQFAGFIKLPKDFKGDADQALEWYVNHRKKTKKKRTEYEAGKYYVGFNKQMDKFFKRFADDKDVTRAGMLQLNQYNGENWEEKECLI